MELSLKKEKKVNYPTKTTINFISDAQSKQNRAALIGFAIFLVFFALFVKFAIIDPLAKINEAQAAYNEMNSQLDVYRNELKDYADVQARYNEVVGTFMSDNEASYLDRTDIIKMINEDIKENVDIQSITISGNTARVKTGVSSMDTVSSIVDILVNDSRNSYVTVSTTQADNNSNEQVYADIVVNYSGVAE